MTTVTYIGHFDVMVYTQGDKTALQGVTPRGIEGLRVTRALLEDLASEDIGCHDGQVLVLDDHDAFIAFEVLDERGLITRTE